MDDELKKRLAFELRVKEAEKRKEERMLRVKAHWNNLPHFEKPDDVPDIPIVDKQEYQDFYVPKLIEAGAIPKKDLIDGGIYLGKHRRCTEARWNQKINKFEYWREKFGTKFIDTCNHFEDDDGFALFVPIRKIELAFD